MQPTNQTDTINIKLTSHLSAPYCPPSPAFSQPTKTAQPTKTPIKNATQDTEKLTYTELPNISLPGASKDARYETFLAMFI